MDIIEKIIKRDGVWEEHVQSLIKQYVTEDDICVDIGSHWGFHTELMCKLGKWVYSFEADTENYLKQKERLKNSTNLSLFNIGLSDKEEEVEWDWKVIGNSGSNGLKNNPMGTYTDESHSIEKKEGKARLQKLDNIGIPYSVKLIKIDVEGYESKVIRGGINTILNDNPIILLESWSNHYGGVEEESLKKVIHPLLPHYTYTHIKDGDWLLQPIH